MDLSDGEELSDVEVGDEEKEELEYHAQLEAERQVAEQAKAKLFDDANRWEPPLPLRSTRLPDHWWRCVEHLHGVGSRLLESELINVLLLGVQGTGKSALINTLLSTFSSRLRPSMVVSSQGSNMGTDSHVTFAVQRLHIPNTKIQLVDVWGERSGDESYGDFLEELLRGHIRDGTKESEWRTAPRRRHPKYKHRIHVCIYVLRVATAQHPRQREKFFEHQKKMQAMGIDLIVVLSAVDQLLPRDVSVLHTYDHASVRRAIRAVHEQLPTVKLARIFPATLYTTQRTRNKAIELMAMAPLMEAVRCARMRHTMRAAAAARSPADHSPSAHQRDATPERQADHTHSPRRPAGTFDFDFDY